MDIRDWMNNNSAVVTVGAVLLLIVALFLLMKNCQGQDLPPPVTQEYYYDMNKKELFIAKASQIVPIETDSGPYSPYEGVTMGAGVKANVYACGDCSDANNRFIGYLEMYKPDAKKKMEEFAARIAEREGGPEMPVETYMMYEEGQILGKMYRKVGDNEPWVLAESEEGHKILKELTDRCPDAKEDKSKRLRPCFPKTDE